VDQWLHVREPTPLAQQPVIRRHQCRLGEGPKAPDPVPGLSLFWHCTLGWFSILVVACALVIGGLQHTLVADPVFGVLWFMSLPVLGLHKESLTRMTGWITVFISHLTGAIPA
jgi:hypothetical protein